MSDRPDRPPAEDEPQPEPAERPEEPIAAESREPDPVVEPVPAHPAAPIQIAPDPGTAPLAAEPQDAPEPALSEPESVEPATSDSESPAPAETDRTEQTLGLPPTTYEPPPPPQERMPTLEGVTVPFAAPPTERSGGRFTATLVIGIAGGLVVIGAVVVALVLSLVTLANSLMEKIETTAEVFVADIADEQWNDAYGRLCPEMRERPVGDYIDEWASWEAEGAEVRQIRDTMDGTYVSVELGDGSTVELQLLVDQESTAIDSFVCGWEHTTG